MTPCVIFSKNNRKKCISQSCTCMYFFSRMVYGLPVNKQDCFVYLLNKCLGKNDIVPVSLHCTKY